MERARGVGRDAAPRRALGPGLENRRLLLLCGAASVALVVLVQLAMRVPPLDLQELGALKVERVHFDFLERLANARANIQYGETRRNCIRQQDRLVCRDARGNLDLERYVASSPATLKDYILVRCIRARPVTDGVLNVTFADVPIGSAIVGYYGIERAGRLMSKRRPVAVADHGQRPVRIRRSDAERQRDALVQDPDAGVARRARERDVLGARGQRQPALLLLQRAGRGPAMSGTAPALTPSGIAERVRGGASMKRDRAAWFIVAGTTPCSSGWHGATTSFATTRSSRCATRRMSRTAQVPSTTWASASRATPA